MTITKQFDRYFYTNGNDCTGNLPVGALLSGNLGRGDTCVSFGATPIKCRLDVWIQGDIDQQNENVDVFLTNNRGELIKLSAIQELVDSNVSFVSLIHNYDIPAHFLTEKMAIEIKVVGYDVGSSYSNVGFCSDCPKLKYYDDYHKACTSKYVYVVALFKAETVSAPTNLTTTPNDKVQTGKTLKASFNPSSMPPRGGGGDLDDPHIYYKVTLERE